MKHSTRLLAILALGTASAAFAQGNPPTTTVPNPATGAGQQSPAGGPMGTTGAQVAQPAAPGAGTGMNTMNTTPPAQPMSPAPMRPMRADRN